MGYQDALGNVGLYARCVYVRVVFEEENVIKYMVGVVVVLHLLFAQLTTRFTKGTRMTSCQ